MITRLKASSARWGKQGYCFFLRLNRGIIGLSHAHLNRFFWWNIFFRFFHIILRSHWALLIHNGWVCVENWEVRDLNRTVVRNCTTLINTDWESIVTLYWSKTNSTVIKLVLVLDHTSLSPKARPFIPNQLGYWVTLTTFTVQILLRELETMLKQTIKIKEEETRRLDFHI